MGNTDLENNIKVSTYSGFKVNERPLFFTVGDVKKKVVDVMARWAEPERDCFRVLADDKMIYTLGWYREEDVWSVIEVSAPDDP